MVHMFGITVLSLIDVIIIIGLMAALAYRQAYSMWVRKRVRIETAAVKRFVALEQRDYWS